MESVVSNLFSFEQTFDVYAAARRGMEIRSWSLVFSAVYVILIFTGRHYMKHRKAFDLRRELVIWNSVLAVFSIVGAVRTLPEFYDSLIGHGWVHSVCDPCCYFSKPTGFWAYAFTLSKVVELGDTAFVVLRKQNLLFLHWYHHVTVMIYCFYSYSEQVAAARWFMLMNFCIHSIMYSYFALRGLQVRVPQQVRISVTSLQIIQMILGVGVVASAYFFKRNGIECNQSYSNMALTVGMYISYLVLFLNFFSQEYAGSRKVVRVGGNDKKE